MTKLRILQLAFDGALDYADYAREKSERFPNNETFRKNYDKAVEEFDEIRTMLKKEERKVNNNEEDI